MNAAAPTVPVDAVPVAGMPDGMSDAVPDVQPAHAMNAHAARAEHAPFCLSVVIANHNYADFLGAAIDSALALDWPDVEVIVVDDGSTDASREVIRRYGDRVLAIFQDNAGQSAAHSVGYARTRGEAVIFLDSDDVLSPELAPALARVWHASVSKVQFQMKAIDAAGHELGTVFPQFHVRPTPDRILHWVLSSNAYPTPPGSGNVYARWFLEHVFPLDGLSRVSDSYFLSAAPFFGEIVTVAQPLVSYRVHGRNDGAFSALDVNRFGREVTRGMDRFVYSQRMARQTGYPLPDAVRDRSLTLLSYRLASWRLAPQRHPMAGDNGRAILRDLARAAVSPQGLSVQARLALTAWSLLVLALPASTASALVLWRFAPTSRPRFVQRFLSRLRVVHGR